ncbi:hypothetical protein Pth03_55570 [Planotetraspora thailandica]|uniref:FG-GAP repeat protein n=1 Tax=Planotetraspora thailandica TaxID=487172 RepID=A0A8J3XZA7_9ACTN|nr:FG-GAP repeat protein [Planotetraspora thailandica]GII57168.1 hypothetical protein Pth03_55570 [Planotetraspora thailandica]
MSVSRMSALLAAALATPAALVAPIAAASPALAAAKTCPAFVAVASPYATVDGQTRAGTVTVYGSAKSGLKKRETLSQGTAGIGGAPERNDSFGSAVAKGDFDGDGCADLAVGVSEEVVGKPDPDAVPGADGNGVVHILFGSPSGFTRVKTIDVTHLGRKYGTDRFGAALAAGDLDGDGDDELIVGAPGITGGGGIGVFGLSGRSPYGTGTLITQTTSWVHQKGDPTDLFGAAVAAGDFKGNGKAQIAVGAPGDGGTSPGSGVVTIVDPRGRHATAFTQNSPGVLGGVEKWDAFGSALATGDFNADGRDDLAIGVPGEDVSSSLTRGMDYGDGAVNVLYGSARGLTATANEMWTQTILAGVPRYYDRFGTSLVTGDLNGDKDDELIVGAPGEGAVQVLAGTRTGGLTRDDNELITGTRTGAFGSSVLIEGGKVLVAAPGSGELTVIGTKVKKGPYPGAVPGTARKVRTGGPDDLSGYALS